MKIEKEILIRNVTEKKKTDNSLYLSISFATLDDGSSFSISSTDMELINTLEPFTKHIANFTLMDSKYGMKLSIDSINA